MISFFCLSQSVILTNFLGIETNEVLRLRSIINIHVLSSLLLLMVVLLQICTAVDTCSIRGAFRSRDHLLRPSRASREYSTQKARTEP